MGITYSDPTRIRRSKGSVNAKADVLSYLLRTDRFNPSTSGIKLSEVKELSKYINARTLQKGEKVFKQGDKATVLYLVTHGKIDLTHSFPDGSETTLKSLSEGELMGWFDVAHDWDHQTTAIARTPALVFQLEKSAFDAIRAKPACDPITAHYESVTEFPELESLKSMMLLRSMDDKMFPLVVQLLSCEMYSPGTRILNEGKNENTCFFISRGDVVATITDSNGFPRELTTVSAGKCVGERSLLSNKTCICSITCLNEVQALVLRKSEFEKLLELCPQIKSTLNRRQIHFSNVDKLLNEVQAFKTLSSSKKLLLAYCVKEATYKSGCEIIKENVARKADERLMHIIVEGEVEVVKSGRIVRKLKRGGFFGELSLLDKADCEDVKNGKIEVSDSPLPTASVRAKTQLKCYTLTKGNFTSLFTKEKELLAQILIRILGKNSPLTVLLQHPETRKSLEEYCKTEISIENVHFWLAVNEIEAVGRLRLSQPALKALKVRGEDFDKMKTQFLEARTKAVHDRFIAEGSTQEINVNGMIRQEIIDKVIKGEYDFKLFTRAKDAVIQLMNNDTFIRYKRSLAFTRSLKSFNSYMDEEDNTSGGEDEPERFEGVQNFYKLLKKRTSVFSDDRRRL